MTGHIKMTVTCMEINESIVFEYDANNKKADIFQAVQQWEYLMKSISVELTK